MPVPLLDSLATTEPLAEIFSDRSILGTMLEFEVALARVEARLQIIPQAAADVIASAAKPDESDMVSLSRQTLRAGTMGIPLSRAFREIVKKKDPAAAEYVHWGATSQDVSDTALVLLLKRTEQLIAADLSRVETALRSLAERHRGTVMLGRTLLQPSPPITFGLKTAGWYAAVHRDKERLTKAFAGALLLQFGGAAGTLAAFGERGPEVARALAAELGLTAPDAPWHTHRDRLGGLMCSCGVLTGTLGKIAHDISLMMQTEVGEVAEPGGDGRGGSSSMPHKRNPIGCAITLAAATRVPGQVASYLFGMVQEHERGVGGLQSEWSTIASIVQATGVAANSMAEVVEGLHVDVARMRQNLDATWGTIFAEKAMILLAPKVGRQAALALLEEATRKALAEQKSFGEVLGEMPEVRKHLDPNVLKKLDVAGDYLGSAELFRSQQLRSSASEKKPEKGRD